MSKVLINNTVSTVFISDVGINLPVGSFTIPPQNYGLWASSSDIIVKISDLSITVNDGSSNLSIADGVALIQGQFPKKITGGTDGSFIGNTSDRLKVDSQITSITDPASAPTIIKQNEITVATKTQSDLASTTYTVPAGKQFKLTYFGGSYDTTGGIYLRLKKQTGGSGAFNTVLRVAIKQQPQEPSTQGINLPLGLVIGSAGDVFKITYEAALAKGTLWSGFIGVEF